MALREPENFTPFMTVEEVKEEVMILNLDNIKKYPISDAKRMDFYSLWNRFGPQAGRDIMIPMVWYGYSPRPLAFFA